MIRLKTVKCVTAYIQAYYSEALLSIVLQKNWFIVSLKLNVFIIDLVQGPKVTRTNFS